MNIDYLVQNCINKMVALEKILKENALKTSETAYISDDIIDIPVLKAARLSVCPVNACEDVKKYVDYIFNPQRRRKHCKRSNRTYYESKR
ncbi:MAG: HAD hydrolase family protein [Endomicrobium sp.]|jgi:3-deoxy-D-manno-octulosonate 8-phosphate phosphatase KdsC-like HAD superfamily phosphatase|nr:HAD hydrolase family protein [Endomicrobium sp.]